MLFIEVLMSGLLLIAVGQSLKIYQPSNRKPHNDVYLKFKSLNDATSSKVSPYQGGTTSLNFQQPGFNNIYPVLYQYNNKQQTTTHPHKTASNANEQPATAVSLKSDTLHEPTKNMDKCKQPSSGNYNNKNSYINTLKRANPLANNKKEDFPKFVARKARNLKENQVDKLIVGNMEERKEVNDDDDQQYTMTAASSSKQPSSPTTMTCHEIRYLHDIFLNYPRSHHVNFGHIQLSPALFEKRFESQKSGNRYKGEIMWLDNTGGFAQHYWDLAQGRL